MCNVLPELVQNGCDVHLICSVNRCCDDAMLKLAQLEQAGVKVHLVPMTRSISPLGDIFSFFSIMRILRQERFDIVHTHCSKAGVLGRIAAFLVRTKIRFHSSHCFAFLRCGNMFTKSIYRIVEKVLARITTRYIAVSIADMESAQIAKIYAAHKCVIINNGLAPTKSSYSFSDSADIRVRFDIPLNSFIVATGCRLVEYKGLFVFLEAARLSHANCMFLIAGEGELRPDIERYIDDHGLREKVRLLGHVHDMERLYTICDTVVLCSDHEAQPYLILEAMRAGRAIIASDVPGNRELLGQGKGILVEQNPANVAIEIDNLVADIQKRNQLGKSAYEYFCDRHTLSEQVQKLCDVYQSATVKNERMCKFANCTAAKTAS